MDGFPRHSCSRKTNALLGGENAQLVRQNYRSNRWSFIATGGAIAWSDSVVSAAQTSRKLDMGNTERCRHPVYCCAFISNRSRNQRDAGCVIESAAFGPAG